MVQGGYREFGVKVSEQSWAKIILSSFSKWKHSQFIGSQASSGGGGFLLFRWQLAWWIMSGHSGEAIWSSFATSPSRGYWCISIGALAVLPALKEKWYADNQSWHSPMSHWPASVLMPAYCFFALASQVRRTADTWNRNDCVQQAGKNKNPTWSLEYKTQHHSFVLSHSYSLSHSVILGLRPIYCPFVDQP